MNKKYDQENDSYYSLRQIQKSAISKETIQNRNAFDKLIAFSHSNKRYLGIQKDI